MSHAVTPAGIPTARVGSPGGGPGDAVTLGSLAAVARRVEARIDSLLSKEIWRWTTLDRDLALPLEALGRLVLAGGKRLRPAFCHWSFVGAGGDPDDPLVADAGASLELIHSFALIHDDVMDDSSRRHGVRTIQREFEERHQAAGWEGDGRRFGEGVAILAGDLAFVYADRLMAGAPREAIDVFDQLRVEVSLGQYLDLVGTARRDTDAAAARRICMYKTGRYTVERPLHLGAALAGRLAELGHELSAYGQPLGEAFQLRDDILGAFGDPAMTGKPVGEDLRDGKPTVLHALAVERARGPGARLLAERFGAADLSAQEVACLQEVLVDTGARQATEATIAALVERSLLAIRAARITPEARHHLSELAYFVGSRER